MLQVKSHLAIVPIFALLLLTVACNAGDNVGQPNSMRLSGANPGLEFFYEIEGLKYGYQPGQTYSLTVDMHNASSNALDVRYCVLLLLSETAFEKVGNAEFVVDPNSVSQGSIDIILPDDLSQGPYGLAVIIPNEPPILQSENGRNWALGTIFVGEQGRDEFHGVFFMGNLIQHC